MKKARAPSTAAAARIPKTRPPVPRVPSNYLSKTTASSDKEKENEIDQLISRVQRVKLNMPSKEEHDAREKAQEAEKKAKATRKAPAPKTTKPAVKKALGRPPKATKPPSPIKQAGVTIPIAAPQAPDVAVAAITPLEQPQPIVSEATPVVTEQPQPIVSEVTPVVAEQPIAPNAFGESSIRSPRQSIGILEPPTELMEMSITPEQLPVPSFLETELLPLTTSPPRPDTPPPPPPSNMNGFVNYNTQTFGTARPLSKIQGQTALQWLPPNNAVPAPALANVPATLNSNRPPSAAGTRDTLPVFTSSGTIPFAPRPNGAVAVPKTESKGEPKDFWEVPETPAR